VKYTVLAIILDVYVYVCICHSFGPIPFFFRVRDFLRL